MKLVINCIVNQLIFNSSKKVGKNSQKHRHKMIKT